MYTGKIPKDNFVIIIGAMKCGTSSLYNYLVKHSAICPCVVKEPEYFSENQDHKHHIANYEDLWDFDPAIHTYALEASTGYTKYAAETDVAKRIRDYGIMPKFIYVVRDPFKRIISHYNHIRYKYAIGRDCPILEDHIVDVSKYYLQLEQFRQYFPKERFLILDFEVIKADPQSVVNKVFDFLEILRIQLPDDLSVHNKTTTMSKFQMFLKNHPQLRKPYLLIPQMMRNRGKKMLKKYSEPEESRKLTGEEREIIYDRLADDMQKFGEEYGFDVSKWGFGSLKKV